MEVLCSYAFLHFSIGKQLETYLAPDNCTWRIGSFEWVDSTRPG